MQAGGVQRFLYGGDIDTRIEEASMHGAHLPQLVYPADEVIHMVSAVCDIAGKTGVGLIQPVGGQMQAVLLL